MYRPCVTFVSVEESDNGIAVIFYAAIGTQTLSQQVLAAGIQVRQLNKNIIIPGCIYNYHGMFYVVYTRRE